MSNEKFKVKFGLAVGDTQATIDGTTGNIVTNGDLDVKGGNITNTLGPIDITSGVAGNITIQPDTTGDIILASDTVYVGDSGVAATITTNGNASLTISNGNGSDNIVINPASGTTVNDGNLILGQLNTDAVLTTNGTGDLDIRTGSWPTSANIKLNDGTNGNIVVDTDGTGQVVINADVDVNGTIYLDQLQVDNININGNTISSTDTNGNIIVAPNGTGAVQMNTGTVQLGTGSGNAQITTNGAYDLTLNTNNGSASGTIVIADGANGNITVTPNGTGNLALTASNGGNLTNTRNYVFGAIRNATTASIGDIWALNSTGPTQPFRGISIDNSSDTTKLPGYIARSYSNTAGFRGRLIFERARGTAASPTAVQAGDQLGEVDVTGYTSTGWINDNIAAVVPGFFGFTAAENWTSNTNIGTNFALTLAPTATTITAAGNLITTITSNPQGLALRGDVFSIAQGKTSAFTATGCSTSGTTLTIGTLTAGTIAVGQQVQTATSAFTAGTYIVANISGSGSGSTWTLSTSQTTSTQTVTGNTGFIGSPTSGGTTDILQNLRLLKNTIQGSTGTTQITTSASGTTLALAGNTINLQTAAAAAQTSAGIGYTRTYGEFCYTNAAGFTIPAQNTIYAMPIDTTNAASGTSTSNTSRINISVSGWYKIIMSLQATSTHNGVNSFNFWLRKNGTDVANSKTEVDFLKDQKSVIAMDWLVNSNGTDYWEIVYASSNAAYASITFPTIAATTTPFISPLAPAVIFNVIPIGM